MKQALILIVVLFSIISCNKSETVKVIPNPKEPTKNEQFGFNFNDFNVLYDTIHKGDTFGNIIEDQNTGDKEVYDIIKKVKDSFDVRTIRIGKAFTFLRTKDRYKKLQIMVYQPDRGSYRSEERRVGKECPV